MFQVTFCRTWHRKWLPAPERNTFGSQMSTHPTQYGKALFKAFPFLLSWFHLLLTYIYQSINAFYFIYYFLFRHILVNLLKKNFSHFALFLTFYMMGFPECHKVIKQPGGALPFMNIRRLHPAAVADLRIVPTFPGSLMLSQISVIGRRFSVGNWRFFVFGKSHTAVNIVKVCNLTKIKYLFTLRHRCRWTKMPVSSVLRK